MSVRVFEFTHLNVWWDTNAYGSVVWLLLGLHTTHIVTDFLDTRVLARADVHRPDRGEAIRRRRERTPLYWYFVVARLAADLRGDLLGAEAAVASIGLWSAMAAGPMAWLTTLALNYVLAEQACGPQLAGVLPLISGVMLAVVAGAAVFTWRLLRNQQGASPRGVPASSERHDFMGHTALLSCGLFAIAIVAQMVPPWILHDCR